MLMPIISLDWFISVRVCAGGYRRRIHSQRVTGLGGRYMGRLLCRWDESDVIEEE